MNRKRIHHFRNIIVRKIVEIELAESKNPVKSRRTRTESADPIDAVPVELDLHMELSIREWRGQTLRELQQALERIDGGMFGVCESCGDEIPVRRLLLRPAGRLCKACQQHAEDFGHASRQQSVFDDWSADGCQK